MAKRIYENKRGEKDRYLFKQGGIIETVEGKVAGFWIKDKKGRRQSHLFEKPIAKEKAYRVERKNVVIDGVLHRDFPVKVYPLVNGFTHWERGEKDKTSKRA